MNFLIIKENLILEKEEEIKEKVWIYQEILQ